MHDQRITLWILRSAFCLACVVAAAPAAAQNLLTNPGFEQGSTGGWFPFGPVALSASTSQSRSGSWSGLAAGRTDTWNGAAQDIAGLVAHGQVYRVQGWVRLANASTDNVQLTIKQIDGAGEVYTAIDAGTATDQGWFRLSGSYTVQIAGSLTSLEMYFEGPAAGVDFYVDDARLEAVDWLADANASIEAIRKRDVDIVAVDALGNGIPSVNVQADQISHRFAFGSTMNGNVLTNPSYQTFFTDHFGWAVFENESKWYHNEPQQGNVTYTTADLMVDFCEQNEITMRGHAIFWAVPDVIQSWLQALDDPSLQLAVEDRLTSVVNQFKGKFVHWDVNNEMLHGSYFADRLGAGIRTWMFQRTRELDDEVRLFVNDFNVITSTDDDAYKAQIQQLIAQGAEVNGIGAQGHFGSVVEPLTVLDRLDNLATLGLPIWISEYDSVNPDENVRADNLETLYRIAFGHPAVEGILMWGFWAGDHWRGADAAIVDLDWTLNAAGERYEGLMAEWTTQSAGIADGVGSFGFRGFHGGYEVGLSDGIEESMHTIGVEPGVGSVTFHLALDPAGCLAAGEVRDLFVAHDPITGASLLQWTPPATPVGMAIDYDVLTSADAADFADETTLDCLVSAAAATTATDTVTPAAGEVRYYLVRARNRCGWVAGSLGTGSGGVSRSAGDCF